MNIPLHAKLEIHNLADIKRTYENLKTLTEYIAENVSPAHFDMGNYRAERLESGETRDAFFEGFDSCGTVGCAVGWIPWAFNMSEKDLEPFESDMEGISFFSLSVEKFGFTIFSELGEFLFSSDYINKVGENSLSLVRLSGEEQKVAFIDRANSVLTFMEENYNA